MRKARKIFSRGNDIRLDVGRIFAERMWYHYFSNYSVTRIMLNRLPYQTYCNRVINHGDALGLLNYFGPIISLGMIHSSNCSAVKYPLATAPSLSVSPSLWAFLAISLALS